MRVPLLLLLVALPALAAPVEQVVDYDGCDISGRLRDAAQTSFVIRLKDAPYSGKRAVGVKSWWGIDGKKPHRVIAMLAVRIGAVDIAIPRNAYSDLADPAIPLGFYLMQLGGDVYLYVKGGDGSASYAAKFLVRGGRLLRRETILGEAPESKPAVLNFEH
jgi:hypothetical protein